MRPRNRWTWPRVPQKTRLIADISRDERTGTIPTQKPRSHIPLTPLVIGWRECVGLPDLGLPAIEAKIDTGARTSALHAEDVETFWQDDVHWVRFHVPHGNTLHASDCTAPLVDKRHVKNTSGEPEERLVIETTLVLNRRRWRIEVTLADRANMTLPLILGRTALRRHRVLVDPGKSHLIRRNSDIKGKHR